MATTSTGQPRLASSIRLVLAMFQLSADIATGFGQAVLDILKKQYPDQTIDVTPASVGNKLLAISRKQNQGDDSRSMDAIQDFLTYISVGSLTEKTEDGGIVKRTSPKPWNFKKDFKTWQEALQAIYSNVRRRSMDKSMDNSKRRKREKSVDDAFGKRGEDGGAADGGEARMPTPDENALSKALDEKAASKEFMDLIGDLIPRMISDLPTAERVLFKLIYEDEVGGFGSDIKDNMGQATAFKEKLEGGSDEEKAIAAKNDKRWSGFVSDTRRKLLTSIQSFIENTMPEEEYDVLYDTFFSDTSNRHLDKIEKEKTQGKQDYHTGLDKRKYGREKWKEENGLLDDKEKASLRNLEKKLKGAGIDPSSIELIPGSKPAGHSKPADDSFPNFPGSDLEWGELQQAVASHVSIATKLSKLPCVTLYL